MKATVLHHPDDARSFADHSRAQGRRVGLVLTMGALHTGHMSLVEAAARLTDEVIVTVFVNPTQFGPAEDYSRYPRTLEHDIAMAEAAGATCIFAPSAEDMYAKNEVTRVFVSQVTETLCGPFRPGHFAGVATVVAKFFGIVGPSIALFGRKDYQQLQVIKHLVRDLFLPIEIVGAPIVRDLDGVALSSRNAYLTPAERADARSIPSALGTGQRAFLAGERSRTRILALVRGRLEASALEIQYLELVDADTLAPFGIDQVPDRALLAVAAFSGKTRLIDNVVLGEDESLGEFL